MVEWSTLAELNTAGFNLYRSTDPNDLSPEHLGYFDSEDPGGFGGADYELKDSNVQAYMIYFYWLEGVMTGGGKSPLSATQETGWYGLWLPFGFKQVVFLSGYLELLKFIDSAENGNGSIR
jgi:hypothetical protein